jgi:hypothetical protein
MAEAAPKDVSIPKQFHTTMTMFVSTMGEAFPECEALKAKKLILSMASDDMHELMVLEWNKHASKPEIKAKIKKKDAKLFKDLRKVDMLADLSLHKKWTDKRLSMQARDVIWMYIQNLTQMAAIHCGDADEENAPVLEAFGRLQGKLGMEAVNETTGQIDFSAIGQLATTLITNPHSEESKDIQTIYGAVGEMFGGNPIAMAQQAYAMMQQQQAEAGGASAAAPAPTQPPAESE